MLRTLLEQEKGEVGIDLKDVLLEDREAVQSWQFVNRTEPNSETVPPPFVNGSRRSGHKCGGATNKRNDDV